MNKNLNYNVGIIVTARTQSQRLEKKVLQQINGKAAIEILLDHLDGMKYPVILAIPDDKENDVLETIAIAKGIECYRGENDSPLHRIYECAKLFEFEHVVRITHDDILIDKMLLNRQINFHIRGGQGYTYLCKCPEGVAGEVFSMAAYEKVIDEVGDKPIEFISYYFKLDNDHKEYFPPLEYQYSFRLTLDFQEDLTLLRVIHACLKDFGTLDVINFLKKHKYMLRINKLPAVTVYTTNYNYGHFITDCMQSVYAQSYHDFEFIILDDCSTDTSLNTITEYLSKQDSYIQNKTRVLRNDSNKGLPACCNQVLKFAKGKYIIRVDADDTLEPNALEYMMEIMKVNTTNSVFSSYYRVNEHLEKIDLVLQNDFHPGCCLLETRCVNDIKYKNGLEYMEGTDFWDRFKDCYSHVFCAEPLWRYRQHPEQKTKQIQHPANLPDDMTIG